MIPKLRMYKYKIFRVWEISRLEIYINFALKKGWYELGGFQFDASPEFWLYK